MNVMIRRAIADDAGAIAILAAEALATPIDADSPRLRRLLAEGFTYTATLDEDVVGFADSFVTFDREGRARFELDLLAVAPQMQGGGIGSRLIEASLHAARHYEPALIRALVRSDNQRMRRLCHRHGFSLSEDNCALFITAPRPVNHRQRQHRAQLIAVETLAYDGMWLEGALSQDAIDDAHWIAMRSNMSTIGAVVSGNATDALALLRVNAFIKVGDYNWWTFIPGSG
jgi:GNAT superfamily N-acetyltransferase